MTMNRRRVFAAAAAAGALACGTLEAMPGMGAKVPKPSQRDVDDAMRWLEGHYESIEEVMAFTPAQRKLWSGYLKVRLAAAREHLEWMTAHPLPAGVDRQARTAHAVELLELRTRLMKRVHDARQPLVDALSPRQTKMLDRFEPHGGMTASIGAGAVVGPKGSHPGMMQKFSLP